MYAAQWIYTVINLKIEFYDIINKRNRSMNPYKSFIK